MSDAANTQASANPAGGDVKHPKESKEGKEDEIQYVGDKGPKSGEIHSPLKDELDKEIAKKPEAEWGVTQNNADDAESQETTSNSAPATSNTLLPAVGGVTNGRKVA